MTLQELITDLKAAGANENTIRLAMNCYQIGRMEVVYAHTNETVQTAIAIEREECAKLCDEKEKHKWLVMTKGGELVGIGPLDCAAAIRARGQHDIA